MRRRRAIVLILAVSALALAVAATTLGARAPRRASAAPPASRSDWPMFAHDPHRSGMSTAPTGVTAADLGDLVHRTIGLPGTVDSTPIFLHAVRVAGATRDVFVMTTTYGRTLAMGARTGALLWTFTPKGIARWAGTAQITAASPAADPDRRFVYATSPDGRVHKLSLANGHEAGGRWPVSMTRDATHEKLTSSLNVFGPRVIVTTGGYIGDIPPYDGKAITIDRASGRIDGVFNSLCADRHVIYLPRTCKGSDSAIWARSGAVVMGNGNLLVATGNGPYDGHRNFGDSVIELSPDARRIVTHYTPPEQQLLNNLDLDLGSSAPALMPGGNMVMAGKDAVLRVLDRHLHETDRVRIPEQTFNAEAVDGSTAYVTTFGSTAAYRVTDGHLRQLWADDTPATSPVLAGGLLYLFDPEAGNLNVDTAGGRRLATLPAQPGHWQTPTIGDGAIAMPQGNGNDHLKSGTLSLFVTR